MNRLAIRSGAGGIVLGILLGWLMASSASSTDVQASQGRADPTGETWDGDTAPRRGETHMTGAGGRTCPDGGGLPIDGGTPARTMEPMACAELLIADSTSMMNMAVGAHRRALRRCRSHYVEGADESPRVPGSRETCGVLSEQLWNDSEIEVRGYLEGLHAAYGSRRAPGRVLFADESCESMDDDSYGAALHVVSAAPDWVSESFFRCAIARETDESFILFMLLRLAQAIPDAREWVRGREFTQPNLVEAAAALR